MNVFKKSLSVYTSSLATLKSGHLESDSAGTYTDVKSACTSSVPLLVSQLRIAITVFHTSVELGDSTAGLTISSLINSKVDTI